MIKEEMGTVPAPSRRSAASNQIIILAVLALIVVKALAESPWASSPSAHGADCAVYGHLHALPASGRVAKSPLLVSCCWRLFTRRRVIAHDPYSGPGADLLKTPPLPSRYRLRLCFRAAAGMELILPRATISLPS